MSRTSSYQYRQPQYATHHDRCREIMSIDNLVTPQRSHLGGHTCHLQPSSSRPMASTAAESAFERTPREKREPYSDQAQFYIMFIRVGKEKDWSKIEHSYQDIFGHHRAKDGLTAVYYRIRSKWGLPPVNKCSQEMSEEGKDMIRLRARSYDQGFLRRIGYFDWCQSSEAAAALR